MPDTDAPLAEREIRRLAELYRLSLDVTHSAGTFGSKEGRETGASVEIQDFRDYVPGDDVRRIDWFSSARTDRLILRLYREEVSPFFDLVVDTSSSMAIRDGRKGALAHELCRWVHRSAAGEGVSVRIFAAGEAMERLTDPTELDFSAAGSVLLEEPRRATEGLRRSSVRLVLSDFMSPTSPSTVVKALSAGCVRLIVVQLLGPWENDPEPVGPAVLESVEAGRRADLTLDRRAVEDYTRRLGALKDELRDQTHRCGGIYVKVIADQGLEDVLRSRFLPLGLAEVH